MYKVKDTMELKELEKYGYKLDCENNYYKLYYGQASPKDIDYYYDEFKSKYSYLSEYFCAEIDIQLNKDKTFLIVIYIYSHESCEVGFNSIDEKFYLQDIINAGLVDEK